MPAAMRSAFTASIAVTGAAVIAISPLSPDPGVKIPTVSTTAVELTAAPAFGGIGYQILVNLLGDGVALAPILLGSTAQCTACIGPVVPPSPTASPFTGWGVIGIGAGLLSSPIAIAGALAAGQSLTQALGIGLLAIQIPIDNTYALLSVSRIPYGGYDFEQTRARARQAATDAVIGSLGVAQQVLTGVRTIINGTLAGVSGFAQTLAEGGDIISSIYAGLYPITTSIQTAVTNTIAAIGVLREAVYTDLTSGPGASTSPIPTISAAAGAVTSAARVASPRRAVRNLPPAAAAKSSGGTAKTRPARTRSTGRSG